jgi:hypothetical protein
MWAVARTWWSIRVELVGGRGVYLWPRPGRILAASRSHTFAQLADAVNAAFTPREPLPYFGWGAIPDQYGRESSDDDAGPDPELRDLPPLIQW